MGVENTVDTRGNMDVFNASDGAFGGETATKHIQLYHYSVSSVFE